MSASLLQGANLVCMVYGRVTSTSSMGANDSPAIVEFNGVSYGYVKNLQGDVIAIVNASGTKVVEYTYDAWGKPLSKTGSMASTLGTLNPFRYRGYVYDEETGLYYLRSRYYNPNWCRFVNADTFLGRKAVLNHNLFAYCANNPVVRTDQSGKYWGLLLLIPFVLMLTGCTAIESSNMESTVTFESEYDAVLNFAERYGQSTGEYGATIMRTPTGRFYYTTPNYNEGSAVVASFPTMEQLSTDTIVAQCHSHPAIDDVGSLIPSTEDIRIACVSVLCSRGYVIGSDGSIFMLDRGKTEPLLMYDEKTVIFNFEIKVLQGQFTTLSPIKYADLIRISGQ